ncbi:MAG: hypothetical protein GEV12_14385 [Micromonosporaceae bacterium]|nr:hypothetical protein [Micromonosporaceae bacterium]
MWTRQWWKDATERAAKTAAQAALAFWAVGDGLLNAWTADWQAAGGVAAGGAVLSYLTSMASTLKGSRASASLVDTGGFELPHLSADELLELARKAEQRETR